jgi:CheY-like chemotaxis protein
MSGEPTCGSDRDVTLRVLRTVLPVMTTPGAVETSRRVLVVEDNEDIRLLLNLWLRDDPRCLSVTEADSVGTALAVTRGTTSYDAVVCDFMLGDGTAADCLRQLRKAWPQARIVVYTASMRVAREAGVLEMGADLVVEKVSVVVEDVVELVLGETLESVPAA